MPLAPGARLGPYEILGTLGAGGMGQVYRASDTNLGRAVAIKVLPDDVAHDAERLARFEREARTLAALNHPNIAAIYGVDTSGPSHALVMELVEGPTLADRLVHGALPLDEALTIAKQIAEALEAAHDLGIVHRDLKPANIKVRPDGTVKVLDFGLAKTFETGSAATSQIAGASLSPTITTPAMTQIGMILGTASYMSPEQARGQSVDRASDIWAFGCVLYEMLGGRLAFGGETITDVLGSIVRVDPDWTALPSDTPEAIRTLVRRCLRKERKRRLKDIADARVEIEEFLAEGAGHQSAKATASTPRAPERARLAWIASAVLLLIAGASLVPAVVHLRETTPDERVIRFNVIVPDKATITTTPPAISPDGRRLAFVASQAGRTQVWVRALDSAVAQPLAGTDSADYPFWSADSRFIAFFSNGKLWKIDASGGPPQPICDAPVGLGGAWNQDGVIVFAPDFSGPLYRVASTGGSPTPATTLDVSQGELVHRSPSFLPDGRHFLFFAQGAENVNGIHIGTLDAKEHRLVLNVGSSGAFVEPGYLLFRREQTLMAQRLDIETLALSGDAIPIAQPIGAYVVAASTFSVSANGVLAYSSAGGAGSDRQLAWFDREGRVAERIRPGIPLTDVALSPEGKQAAVQLTPPNQDIWVVDLVRAGVGSRLTSKPSIEDYPVWSPDGTRVLYTSAAGVGQNLFSRLASGSGSEDEVLRSTTVKRPTDWSSDFILYDQDDAKTQSDLWALPLTGDKKPRIVLSTPFSEQQGRLSPDGKWIAYVSNETGATEIYVQSFPPSGGRWKVSTGGGVTPRWRRDGKELFYLASDRKIMAVDIRIAGATFEYDVAKALFEAPVDAVNTAATNRYDVSADGQRFLVNAPMGDTPTAPINVVVNWLAALQGR